MKYPRILVSLLFVFACLASNGQQVAAIKLFRAGDQTSFPMLRLGSTDQLELHFDDLDGDVKNYYFAFQLCNADWKPSMLTTFDYVKGFQNVRITNYRSSSLTTTRYTHYQAALPDRSAIPTRSGNYLLKVFLNGDTSRTVFTRRFVVVDEKAKLALQVQQPFNSAQYRTGHKLQIAVNTDQRLQVMGPADLKVVVLQNANWTTSAMLDRPTIFRGNYFEYSDEATTGMPAGREFRWADLRSYRLRSDRVQDVVTQGQNLLISLKPDPSRAAMPYAFYRDLNGSFTFETLENNNPLWQSEYASVRFTYFPEGNKPLAGKDLYLFGELTNWASDTSAQMQFNEERGAYEKVLRLKQGYYSYNYATMPAGTRAFPDFSQTEGNFWNTEDSYTVLVYYRGFGARADELIGSATVNSLLQRTGL